MKCRTAVRFCLVSALLTITAALVVPDAAGQADLKGQWSELPYTMPINPVHAALMHTGQVLVVSGSGNVAGNPNYQAAVWDPSPIRSPPNPLPGTCSATA